jgi:hypothetical protein
MSSRHAITIHLTPETPAREKAVYGEEWANSPIERGEEPELVTVPFDYLLSMHLKLNASFEKMKEILGESQAMMLFTMSADSDLPALQLDTWSSIDELKRLLSQADYRLDGKTEGDTVTFTLGCPYAERIHPYLGRSASFCPMSQTLLSTVRKRYGKTVVTSCKLNRKGSTFTLKIQE